MKTLCGTLALAFLSGCASAYKSFSSGQVGCEEDDIEVTHLVQGVLNETWIASCQGKRFVCSRTGGLGTIDKQVSCKEAVHVVAKRAHN